MACRQHSRSRSPRGEDECAICLDTVALNAGEGVRPFQCMHRVHSWCAGKLLQSRHGWQCPLCRAQPLAGAKVGREQNSAAAQGQAEPAAPEVVEVPDDHGEQEEAAEAQEGEEDQDGDDDEEDDDDEDEDEDETASDELPATPVSFEDLSPEEQLRIVAKAFTREDADSIALANLCENVNSQLLVEKNEACTKYLLLHVLYKSNSVEVCLANSFLTVAVGNTRHIVLLELEDVKDVEVWEKVRHAEEEKQKQKHKSELLRARLLAAKEEQLMQDHRAQVKARLAALQTHTRPGRGGQLPELRMTTSSRAIPKSRSEFMEEMRRRASGR